LELKDLGILIVDDDSIIREMLRLILKKEGLTKIEEAGDGEKARIMLHKMKQDVVFLDINMPGEDGFSILDHIKADYSATHVIMFSAETSAEKVKKALAAGASGFVAKPFNAARVIDNIKKIFPDLDV